MFFSKFFKKPAPKPKLGIALGSGGAKGLAHIGAIKAFEENGIEFDYVAGTSIGSIVGAFYAEGYTADEMLHLLETVNYKEISNLLMMKMDTVRLEDVINRYIGDLSFDELKKPFTAVATELSTGKEVDINSGSIAKALCASSSYPPFFKAVYHEGKYLIDGAFSNAVPADLVKGMGADFIVGIDLAAFKRESRMSAIGGLFTNVRFDNGNTSAQGYEFSDVMLRPDLGDYSATSFGKLHEMYEIGYETAMAEMDNVKAGIAALHKKGRSKHTKEDGKKKD